jgi:uncharacterized protein (DUF2384 family)
MHASDTAIPHRQKAPGASAARDLDWSALDAWILALFDDKAFLSQVRRLEKVELVNVWHLTERALEKHRRAPAMPVGPIDVHKRLLAGLRGESLLVSSSMFLNSLSEVERFFDISFKTIKSKIGKSLDTPTSELAMRAARVTAAAAEVLGDFDMARQYMHTRNFALGGATPAELLKTSEGERMVLNELQAHAEGGPL